jgi:3-hydroxyisobutyrate dehydrogenase-like beta-hydroxyacid dehydrogenase
MSARPPIGIIGLGLKMINSDYAPHAWLTQSMKDFKLMHEVAARVGQELPLATQCVALIESLHHAWRRAAR